MPKQSNIKQRLYKITVQLVLCWPAFAGCGLNMHTYPVSLIEEN